MWSQISIINYLIGPILTWLPLIFKFLVLILIVLPVAGQRYRCFKFFAHRFFSYSRLLIFVLVAGFAYALLLTGVQYYVWRLSLMGRYLLPPYQGMGYFIHYSYNHFYLASLLSLLVAAMFFGLMSLLRKSGRISIGAADLSLCFLLALLSTWPGIIIFLALFLIFSLVAAVVNVFRFKIAEFSPFWPLISASALTILFGRILIVILRLGGLIV